MASTHDTQHLYPVSKEDPRAVLARELSEWWKSRNHDFKTKFALAEHLGIPSSTLYNNFRGLYFPKSKLACAKLYQVTKVPSLHPANAAKVVGAATRHRWAANRIWRKRAQQGMRRYWQKPENRKNQGRRIKLAQRRARRRKANLARKRRK